MENRISLVGFANSGKSTVADYLVREHGFVTFSFADALKDTVAAIFCWDRAALEGATPESRLWREEVDEWWAAKLGIPGLTPRWALRNIGTDVMREHFHPKVWISNVERRIDKLHPDQKFVITDGRFGNEIDCGRSKQAKVFRVRCGPEPLWFDTAIRAAKGSENDRQKMKQEGIHESEWSWTGSTVDGTIENCGKSMCNLYNQIEKAIF